jgi:hypothetical protein
MKPEAAKKLAGCTTSTLSVYRGFQELMRASQAHKVLEQRKCTNARNESARATTADNKLGNTGA